MEYLYKEKLFLMFHVKHCFNLIQMFIEREFIYKVIKLGVFGVLYMYFINKWCVVIDCIEYGDKIVLMGLK